MRPPWLDTDFSGPGNHDIMMASSKDEKKQNKLIGRAGGSGVRNGTCDVKEALARLAKENSKMRKETKLRNKSRRRASRDSAASTSMTADDFSVSIADLSEDTYLWTASVAAVKSSESSPSYSPRTRKVAKIHCDNDDTYPKLYSNDRGNVIDMFLFTIIEEDPDSEGERENENIDVVAAVQLSCQRHHQQHPSMQHSLLEKKDGVTVVNSEPSATAVVVASKPRSKTKNKPMKEDGGEDAINCRNVYYDKEFSTTIMAAETANKKAPSAKGLKPKASESAPAATTNTQSESTPSPLPQTRDQILLHKNDAVSSIDDPKDSHPPPPSMIVFEERHECNARDYPHNCNESVVIDVAVYPHIMNMNTNRSLEDNVIMTPLTTDNVDEIIHHDEESSCSSYCGSNPSNLTEEQNDFIDLIDDSDRTESDGLVDSLTLLSLHKVQSHASNSNDSQQKTTIGREELQRNHRLNEDLAGSSSSDLVFDVPEIMILGGMGLGQDHRLNEDLVGSSGSDLVFDVPEITIVDSDSLQDDYESNIETRIKMATIPKRIQREEERSSCNKSDEKECVPSNGDKRNVDKEVRVAGPGSRKRREKNQQGMAGNKNIVEAIELAEDNAEHKVRKQPTMKSSEPPANDPKVSRILRKSCPPHISLNRGSLRTKNEVTLEATNSAETARERGDAESNSPANTSSRERVANERSSHNTDSVTENEKQVKVGFLTKRSVLKSLPHVTLTRRNSCPPLISWMKRDGVTEATNIAASTRGIENNQDLECAVEPHVSISLSETNEKLDANNKYARSMSDVNILPRSKLVQPGTNYFSNTTLELTNYAERRGKIEDAESNSPANMRSKDWIANEKRSRNTGLVVENGTQPMMGISSKKSVLKKPLDVMLEKATSIKPSDTLATCHSFTSKILSQRLQSKKDNLSSKDLDPARLRKRTQGFDQESSPGVKLSVHDSVGGRGECPEKQENVIVEEHKSNRSRNSHAASHQHTPHQRQHSRNESEFQGRCASYATSSHPSSNSNSFSDLAGCHQPRHDDGTITNNTMTDESIRRGHDMHISWDDLGYAIESCVFKSLLEMNEQVHANNNYARFKRDSIINSRPNLFHSHTNHYIRQQETCNYSGDDVSWEELSDAITEGRMRSINDITRQVVEKQHEWGLAAKQNGSQRHEGVADEPWQCATCTFVNQHGSFLVCGICATPKYQVIGDNVIERKSRHRTDKKFRGSSPNVT
jgi:hypothetical protein